MKPLNLKISFFYKKLREKRFTSEEMKLISKHLYPKEYQEYQEKLLSELLETSRNQIKNGEGINFENILAVSKQKHNVV